MYLVVAVYTIAILMYYILFYLIYRSGARVNLEFEFGNYYNDDLCNE